MEITRAVRRVALAAIVPFTLIAARVDRALSRAALKINLNTAQLKWQRYARERGEIVARSRRSNRPERRRLAKLTAEFEREMGNQTISGEGREG
jgi:hypothetical protein